MPASEVTQLNSESMVEYFCIKRVEKGLRKQNLNLIQECKHCQILLSEPPDMVPVSFGRDLFDEGTFAQAVCTITAGDEPLKIRWSFHGHSISSDQGISTTNIGSRTSILMIQNVGHRHRGNYTCLASNKAGNISHTAELRVNGRGFIVILSRKGSQHSTGRLNFLNETIYLAGILTFRAS